MSELDLERAADRIAKLLHCPDDDLLLKPLYRPGARFARTEFADSLAGCCWPNGSVWLFAPKLGEPAREWVVSGNELVDAETGERWGKG